MSNLSDYKDLVWAAYLRVSSDGQERDGEGLERQRQSIQALADQDGIKVTHWFADVGSRDLAHKRGDFQKLLLMVQDGRVGGVLVSSAERFGCADGLERAHFLYLFRQAGAHLWSALEGCLSDSSVVRQVLNVVEGETSRKEQEFRAERCITTRKVRVKRGEHPGGRPPFGYDLVCVDSAGLLLWRLRYDGLESRVKIYPDGREERYDGVGNMPAREQGQVLKLIPGSEDRVEVVRKIFRWYATENISVNAICKRLNDLKVPAVYGSGWYSSRVKPMLSSVVYRTGRAVWNAQGEGRFLEHVDGQVKPVPRVKDRVQYGRKRSANDVIVGEGEDQGIIDAELWNDVQKKLAGLGKQSKAPKNSRLWLSRFLYCAKCGKVMSGWYSAARGSKKAEYSYCCSSYKRLSRANPYGCRSHRVQHHHMEALVQRWLNETGQKLDIVLGSGLDGEGVNGLLQQIRHQRYDACRRYLQSLAGMRAFVEASLGQSSTIEVDGETYDVLDVKKAYRSSFEQRREAVRQEMEAKTQELRALVLSQSRLSGLSLQICLEEMARLEAVVAALQASLVPLDQKADDALHEVRGAAERLRSARESMAGDHDLKKSEALRKVLARVVLSFRYETCGTQERSILESATFEPLEGDEVTYRGLTEPRRGSPAIGLLTRTYSGSELR